LTYTLCVDGKQAERKEYAYDSFRNVTKYTIYNSEDEETYWCVVTYDKQGRQLELQSMNLLKDELRIGAWKYREDGTLESSTHEFYCELNYKRVCEYDSEGKQSVSRVYGWIESEDGTYGFDTQCRQRIVYSEADNGKKKITTYYSGEDVYVGSDVEVFDEFGNKTQYYAELPDGTIGIAYEKEYLAEGQLKSAKLYDTDGTMYEREEYRYDSFGNLIFKGIYNEKDELKEGTEYEYDAEITDRITQSKHYWGESGNEAITLYEYYERTEEDD